MKSDKHTTFRLGDTVTKVSGSSWTGKVVGFYSTELTPEGYCVESSTETGSVQIYPAKALKLVEGERRGGLVCQNCFERDAAFLSGDGEYLCGVCYYGEPA